MRHVDDAHHPERDGEADSDEHEHGAEAEAEEQRLDGGVQAPRRIDASERVGGGAPHVGVRLDERPVGRVLDEAGQPIAHVGAEAAAERLDRGEPGVAIAAVQGRECQPGLDLIFDGGVGLLSGALPEKLHGRIVERSPHRGDGREADRRIRVRERVPRQRGAEETAQAVVRADLGQFGWRCGAGRLLARGIDQLHRGQAFVRGFHQHDGAVLLTNVEAVFQPAGHRRQRRRMGAGKHTFGDRLLVEEAGRRSTRRAAR